MSDRRRRLWVMGWKARSEHISSAVHPGPAATRRRPYLRSGHKPSPDEMGIALHHEVAPHRSSAKRDGSRKSTLDEMGPGPRVETLPRSALDHRPARDARRLAAARTIAQPTMRRCIRQDHAGHGRLLPHQCRPSSPWTNIQPPRRDQQL